jgi:hypothetical protein
LQPLQHVVARMVEVVVRPHADDGHLQSHSLEIPPRARCVGSEGRLGGHNPPIPRPARGYGPVPCRRTGEFAGPMPSIGDRSQWNQSRAQVDF